MSAGRWWRGALALGMAAGSTGCVERVIYDLDGFAEGGAESSSSPSDTDTDTLGDTDHDPTDVEPGVECTTPEDCGDDQTCYQGVCVGTGTVRISLAWSVVTDLDLHVRVPNGEWISYQMAITPYGQLDVDDCVSGQCLDQDGVHVENVFLDGNAPRGTYGIMVANFDGRREADYTIDVAGESTASFVGYLPAEMFYEGDVHEFTW